MIIHTVLSDLLSWHFSLIPIHPYPQVLINPNTNQMPFYTVKVADIDKVEERIRTVEREMGIASGDGVTITYERRDECVSSRFVFDSPFLHSLYRASYMLCYIVLDDHSSYLDCLLYYSSIVAPIVLSILILMSFMMLRSLAQRASTFSPSNIFVSHLPCTTQSLNKNLTTCVRLADQSQIHSCG